MVSNIGKFFLSVGRFLRVIDESTPILSITNIACIVIIVKIALAAEPSIADLGGLLISLLAYYGKKKINQADRKVDAQQQKDIEDLRSKIKETNDRIGSVAATVGFKTTKI